MRKRQKKMLVFSPPIPPQNESFFFFPFPPANQNTNIPRLYALLEKDDAAEQQLCYYQAGIGTWFNPGVVAPMFRWGARILDEALAWYLDAHVIDGYKFIMNNWKIGDKICLFGFSRGAYTARALAGALHKVGVYCVRLNVAG